MMSAESNSEKSVSYQKKDGRDHTRPTFFWYDNDKDLKVYFLMTRIIYKTSMGLSPRVRHLLIILCDFPGYLSVRKTRTHGNDVLIKLIIIYDNSTEYSFRLL